jgi:hypothetical protein
VEEISMQIVPSADGTRIAFDVFGDGPPVIMVAGAFNTRSTTEALPSSSAILCNPSPTEDPAPRPRAVTLRRSGRSSRFWLRPR